MRSAQTLREPRPTKRCLTVQRRIGPHTGQVCLRLKESVRGNLEIQNRLGRRLSLVSQESRGRLGRLLNLLSSISSCLAKCCKTRPLIIKVLLLRSKFNLFRTSLLQLRSKLNLLLQVSLFNFKCQVAMLRMRTPSKAIARSARALALPSSFA